MTETSTTGSNASLAGRLAADPPFVFIVSWERPIYLWNCLDALYRLTRSPRRFVLIDNASQDPLVSQVIDGFERRGLFHAVHRMPHNEPANLGRVAGQYQASFGSFVGYLDSDTEIVAPTAACWLETLVALLDADPQLALLGSYVDTGDFVDPDVVRRLHPQLDERAVNSLCKGQSPERRLAAEPPPEPVISPFTPPGRLLMARWAALQGAGLVSDNQLHQRLTAQGWRTGISTRVRHRHLSLLHPFDEPGFGVAARDAWVNAFNAQGQATA